MRLILLLLILASGGTSTFTQSALQSRKPVKPQVCLTFDDGNPKDMPGYTWQDWNSRLLQQLQKHRVKSIFFAYGASLHTPQGKQVLEQWSKAGHLIANHTYSHLSYHRQDVSFEQYAQDFLRNDSLIRQFSGYAPFFRYPYLKEGNTLEKRDRFRAFLREQHYRNGYVTIDASDWYIDSRLVKRLKENPRADLEPFRQFYLRHLYERATYYNQLALQLTGRQINHTLLLHHNLSASLFVGDLIRFFEAKGWEVVNASVAYQDPIYQKTPDTLPAGESLIWALAKESGSFEGQLRYPAEDAQYEKAKMDELGL